MNLHLARLRVRKCIVCGYRYSDRHHVYPRSRGGTEILVLCPNHHRYANIVQSQMLQGEALEFIQRFAEKNFDDDFNGMVLKDLIMAYRQEAQWNGNSETPSPDEFFLGIKHEWAEEQITPPE